MRPKIKFLETNLVEKILDEAFTVLCELGVELNNDEALSLLGDHGAIIDKSKITITYLMVQSYVVVYDP